LDGPFYDLEMVYGDKLLFLGQENSARAPMGDRWSHGQAPREPHRDQRQSAAL